MKRGCLFNLLWIVFVFAIITKDKLDSNEILYRSMHPIWNNSAE